MTSRPPVDIMIVEDEFVVARDLRDVLEDLGYVVVSSVMSGEDAVVNARALNLAAIVMDIRLAGTMDGIQAAAQIRSEQDIPIVFLSAHSNESTLRRAIASGPYGYIVKPFRGPELRCAIEVAIAKHEAVMQLEAARRELKAFRTAILQHADD